MSSIRSTFNVGSGRNIAFANYEIDGAAGEAIAVSGQSFRPGTVDIPRTRLFTTQNVGGFSRAFDSEVKLFESIGQRATPTSIGTVRLFTERPMCTSCCSVCGQFRSTFPGIRVFVSSGP